MTDTNIAGQRLFNQHIEGEKFEKPGDVVRWLGAVQAQDYAQSLWAIGLRLRSATIVDVERAICEGKILRTWPMRGTIHFVPPEDTGWMLELSASRMLARDIRRQEQLGLDEGILERCKGLFYEALEGGGRLSRPDMMALLERAGISAEGQRGYHILWYAAQSGLICLGPMRDKQQTFVLLDEWVPDPRKLSREESLVELARRYFASHGPATVHDFARWAGLTVTEARTGVGVGELISETIDGDEYWVCADSPGYSAREKPRVHLLPGFDEYLIGYKDRSAVLAAEHAHKIVPGNNGVFQPTIVVDGRVVGTWKRKLKKTSIDVTLHPFTQLGDSEDKVVEAAKSYGDFIGLPVTIKAEDPAF